MQEKTSFLEVQAFTYYFYFLKILANVKVLALKYSKYTSVKYVDTLRQQPGNLDKLTTFLSIVRHNKFYYSL